jgi:toxin ParE1/3/4
MKVVWLRKASLALDLEYEYLAARNPKAARLVFRRIIATARRLRDFPNSGRPGQIDGTRELVVPGFPYLIVYRVSSNAVEILRVFHTSRDWPELMQ